MPLQVWLPLLGNLDNQGLNSSVVVTNGGATVDSNGKLGKCYNFDGTDDKITLTQLPNPKNITVSFWLYRNANTGTRQFMFTAWNGVTCELTTSGQVYCNITATSGSGSCTSADSITAGSWHHIVYTFEDKIKASLYLDGQLVTYTNCSGSINWSTTTGYLGYWSTYLNGKLNDFRIYDHALSAKEVKLLSQGLVAHYKLSTNNTNLFDFESVASKWVAEGTTCSNYTDNEFGNVLKVVSDGTSNKRIYRAVSNVWVSGQTYTVSFLAKADSTATCTMSRSIASGNFTSTFTLTTTWKRYIGQITSTASSDTGTLSFQINTANVNIYLTQVKLELGSIATPYTPGSGDSHYNLMGYNDTTVYDSSGYNYHGTINTAMSVSSNTSRYSSSTSFNGTDNAITIPYNTLCPSNIFTLNIWFYKTAIGSKNYETLFGGPSGFEMDTRAGTATTLSLYMASTRGSILYEPLEFNVWNMITMARNGTNELYYVNGDLKKTIEAKTMPTGDYFIGAWKTATQQNYYGLISDFRIYATVLSATDIKALYDTGASIDNNGNMYAYEFNEV